jgi:Golgi phosphoprotein 3
MLTTFDKLFLFALQEENCAVLPSTAKRLKFGLVGAILADLTLLGKIKSIEAHKLELVDADPIGDMVLDRVVELFQKTEQARKVSYWLKHLVKDSLVGRKRMFERLVLAGVLSHGEEGFAWVIPYADSPHPNASARYAIKSRLREVVLNYGEPALDDLALLSVTKASRLLNLVFTKGERKAANKRIFGAVMDRVMNDPVTQTLQEIEVALDLISTNG